ncbi:MAG: Peptide transporter substrate-binding protein [Patescibacteria group bacterium]|nr:Peptide transporter substrate-binding protein [Patescibacteria group bacterium]
MIDRSTKLRWRRNLRRKQRQVEDLGVQAEDNLEKHLFNRLSRLTQVRRFIAAWVVLFLLLIGGVIFQTRSLGAYYLKEVPVAGGIYTEGILGSFTNANPLYAASSVDNSVGRLVFAGLFKFDQNNALVGDLGKSWTVDERGTTYTVLLKDNLTWHDGKPLTSADIVYTYAMIQNPDAKSPLASSWTGIKVVAIDEKTVAFTLPSILTSFPYSMTNGIVPKHLLEGVPPTQLRSISFNTNKPIGAGPFKWEAIEVVGDNPEEREQRIALVPNDQYNGGRPKLDRMIIRTFQTQQLLESAFEKRDINAAAGLTAMPKEFQNDATITDYNVPLTSQVMVFFKTTADPFKDVKVRQALSLGVDTKKVLKTVERPIIPSNSPLLRSQVGYDKTVVQKTSNQQMAEKLLDEAGWAVGADGTRTKDGKPLTFILTTQSNSVYNTVSNELKKQWRAIGVDVEVSPQKDNELQSALTVHNYDALLYGIASGPDPDVFAYWHSSQADLRSPNRLNFSEYTSTVSDKALEGGRTRTDAAVRAIKYKPFLEAWSNDAPAIALYQPRYLYMVREPLFNFDQTSMNNGADRFNNVINWMIREGTEPIIPN